MDAAVRCGYPVPPGNGYRTILPGSAAKLLSGSSALILHSIACPRIDISLLVEGQRLAGSDCDLLLYEIDPRDKFRDGMFDLEPGVHLHEIIIPLAVEELNRPGVCIVRNFCDFRAETDIR